MAGSHKQDQQDRLQPVLHPPYVLESVSSNDRRTIRPIRNRDWPAGSLRGTRVTSWPARYSWIGRLADR
jgi:hypothetical protein